jgi:hypothetical protein
MAAKVDLQVTSALAHALRDGRFGRGRRYPDQVGTLGAASWEG